MPPAVSAAELPPPACPRCTNPMTAGLVAFQGRTTWVDKMRAMDASGFKGENLIGFIDRTKFPHFRACRCTICGVLLMGYGAGILYTPWFWEKNQAPVVVKPDRS